MPGVFDPGAQGLASLTDPDDPVLIDLGRDRENQRRQLEQEQREQDERARLSQRDSGAPVPDAARDPADRPAPRRPEMGGGAHKRRIGGIGLGSLALAVLALAGGAWLLMPSSAPKTVAPLPEAPALPLAAANDPVSQPAAVAPPAASDLPAPAAAGTAAASVSEARAATEPSALAAAAPEPSAQPQEPAATAAELEAANERIAANHDSLAAAQDTIAALTRRLDSLEAQLAAPDQGARFDGMEQRLAALEARAARPAPVRHAARPAKPKPAPVVAQQVTRPQPRLLAIDSWAGQPSVVVGIDTPGDKRIRTLSPGQSINGVRLERVDARLGQATFTTADGAPVTLSLSGGMQ